MNDISNIIWENVDISLQTTMYGHLARVWKVIFLKTMIASIGEVKYNLHYLNIIFYC
jgi:hypothetical protein